MVHTRTDERNTGEKEAYVNGLKLETLKSHCFILVWDRLKTEDTLKTLSECVKLGEKLNWGG